MSLYIDRTEAAEPKAIRELYLSTSLTLPGPSLVNKHDSEKVDLLRKCRHVILPC
jgi:hypothetical protein